MIIVKKVMLHMMEIMLIMMHLLVSKNRTWNQGEEKDEKPQ